MSSLYQINLSKVLFLDIETVSAVKSYNQLNERTQKLWAKKTEQIRKNEDETAESIYRQAAIYAEFGKIVCISVGMYHGENFRLKSIYNDDEKIILLEFAQLLNNYFTSPDMYLCAHNGKEFDFPYIARRMLIHGIKLPQALQLAGKKPWETQFIDTMELWKFGDYKNYTSLDLLCNVFDIPTPKDDINGSEVGRVYWDENDLNRIKTYCQKDVLSIAQLMRRYIGLELIGEDKIQYIN